jgi:hypothetical protein
MSFGFFSGDQSLISVFVSICICGGRARCLIKVFTSPDDQFWENSVIIEGTHEVMLVDAQLTKTSAEKVLQEIKGTKKTTVYHLHHP